MVANKIRVLTQMMLWVHNICGGHETDQFFSWLNNKEMDRQTLGDCAGTSEAMRLRWRRAPYGQHGVCEDGNSLCLVLPAHAGLTQEQIERWTGAAAVLADSGEPARLFLSKMENLA